MGTKFTKDAVEYELHSKFLLEGIHSLKQNHHKSLSDKPQIIKGDIKYYVFSSSSSFSLIKVDGNYKILIDSQYLISKDILILMNTKYGVHVIPVDDLGNDIIIPKLEEKQKAEVTCSLIFQIPGLLGDKCSCFLADKTFCYTVTFKPKYLLVSHIE